MKSAPAFEHIATVPGPIVEAVRIVKTRRDLTLARMGGTEHRRASAKRAGASDDCTLRKLVQRLRREGARVRSRFEV